MEPDATQEITLKEALEEAEQAETPVEESSTSEEVSQEEEPEVNEDTPLQELDDDTEFQEAKKELETEMGGKTLSFSQTKRFRKLYFDKKERDRQIADMESQLTELRGKKPSDNEILGEAVSRGLLDLDDKKETPAKEDKFNWEELMMKATPEQREWLNIIDNRAKQSVAPVLAELNQYKDQFGELTQSQKRKELDAIQDEVRNEVKTKYNLDWDKDLLPDVQVLAQDMVKTLPKGVTLADVGWNARTLTNQVIARKGLELARKTVTKETRKLNENKKRANIEVESTAITSEPSPDMSVKDILNEEMQKEGIARFE